MTADLVKAAKIVAAHGLRGQVKLKEYLPLSNGVFHGADGTEYKVTLKGRAGDTAIADVEGVADRNGAEALKGRELYVPQAALPNLKENEFYTQDLVGLEVRDAADTSLGKVINVFDFGAGDLLEIAFEGGKVELYPFRNVMFPEVRIDEGFVRFIAPDVVD